MRGRANDQGAMFYSFDVEDRIPANHPLRKIKEKVERELHFLSPHIALAYSKTGRPSIPAEQLIKATVLQALYTIRSERQLCEQISYNMLFQWFLGLSPDQPVWDHSTFSANRERMAKHGLMEKFFRGSVIQAIELEASSKEHFSVDGTLIAAWASMKSVRPKDEPKDKGPDSGSNGWVDWHGEKRTNETHESKTDAEARLARKGKGQSAILAHSMHLLMENRNGLAVDIRMAEANGKSEREMALEMLRELKRRFKGRLKLRPKTAGADKGYYDGSFLNQVERELKIVPHVATREGAIVSQDAGADARRRARQRERTKGYAISQRCRKRIEQIFGWLKEIGGLKKPKFIGRWKIQLQAYAAGAAYNFLRLVNLETNAA